MKLTLPQPDRTCKIYTLKHLSCPYPNGARGTFNRTAYAAAHIVVDPLANGNPLEPPPCIDWDATLRFREYLWRLGFRVAEAMDTAQRGMGLDWSTARELIRRSIAHARTIPGASLACGVGTDQLRLTVKTTLTDVLAAYCEQIDAVEAVDGQIILMASRAMPAIARTAADYFRVYGELLRQCREPVILHWLGEMFDPELSGYWGSSDLEEAMETVLGIIREYPQKVEGIKISLLDPKWEIAMRRRLPPGVKMFTGDDFNYDMLIAGDGERYSHALLGIFDPIAQVAANALTALAQGDGTGYERIIAPTVALSREVFRTPTHHYKAGVVFLAWLNGHQDHFVAAGGLQAARPVTHYARIFELADNCGALIDPALAAGRMRAFLKVHAGID